jgi:tocopherol O-methyltransferase
VECTEHLFDQPTFFRRAADWLPPGGRIAICAWLAGDGPEAAPQVATVCEHFLCPSLGTADDYQQWMMAAGLRFDTFADLTPRVMRTWEICHDRMSHPAMRSGAWLLGRDIFRFVDHFKTLLHAYRTGAMRYGLFVATKPLS